MENWNGGYVALAVVGVLFAVLQIWWISLTIRNGRNEPVFVNQDPTEDIKKRLEKIFSKIE